MMSNNKEIIATSIGDYLHEKSRKIHHFGTRFIQESNIKENAGFAAVSKMPNKFIKITRAYKPASPSGSTVTDVLSFASHSQLDNYFVKSKPKSFKRFSESTDEITLRPFIRHLVFLCRMPRIRTRRFVQVGIFIIIIFFINISPVGRIICKMVQRIRMAFI